MPYCSLSSNSHSCCLSLGSGHHNSNLFKLFRHQSCSGILFKWAQGLMITHSSFGMALIPIVHSSNHSIDLRCSTLSFGKPSELQASFLPKYFSLSTWRTGSFSSAGMGSSISSIFEKLKWVRLGGNWYSARMVLDRRGILLSFANFNDSRQLNLQRLLDNKDW